MATAFVTRRNDDPLKKDKKTTKASRWISSIPLRPRKTVVVVNVNDDQIGRGDTSGRIGIGQALARLTKGTYLYANDDTLRNRFPAITSYQSRLHALITPHGKANFVIGRSIPPDLTAPHCQTTNEINETLSNIWLKDQQLVAHNLTPAILADGAQAFKEQHPDIKGPLIAVLMASCSFDEKFCKKLADVAAAHGEATIFLCGCRRTSDETIDKTQKKIVNALGWMHKKSVTVHAYKYRENDPTNPYRGLIALADHFVVWGESQSLRSEALVRGKKIHLYKAHDSGELVQRELAHDFEQHPPGKPLVSAEITPLDVTDQVACALLEHKKKNILEACTSVFRTAKHISGGEKSLLQSLAIDAGAITRLPSLYKASARFMELAAAINPLTLEFMSLPARANPRIAAAALIRDIEIAPFIAAPLWRNRDFALRVLTDANPLQVPNIYQRLHPAVQKNRDVYMTACRRRSQTVFLMDPSFRETLRDDKEFMLTLISNDHNAYTKIANILEQDPAFLEKALAANHRVYEHLPVQEQLTPQRAAAFFAAGGSLLGLSAQVCDSDEIARLAVETNAQNAAHISNRLRNSPDFYLGLSKISGPMLRHAGVAVTDNTHVMLHAVSADASAYPHASTRLRDNPHFALFALKMAKENTNRPSYLVGEIPDSLWYNRAIAVAATRLSPYAMTFVNRDVKTHYQHGTDGPHLARALAESAVDWRELPPWFRNDKRLMTIYCAHKTDFAEDPELQSTLKKVKKFSITDTFARTAHHIKAIIGVTAKKPAAAPSFFTPA